MKLRLLSACRSGFTLIEVIIVLFIIAVATGLAGIMITGGGGGLEIKAFSKDIANVLRYARSHAVTEKKVYCFVLDKENHSFTLYQESVDYKDVHVVLKKAIPEDLEMTVLDADADSQYLEFFPFGNSSGGVLEIVNSKGTAYLISVNRVTGKLDMEKVE